MKKEVWKNIVQFLVTVLTALGTAFGVTSCMQTTPRRNAESKRKSV